ncbi:hypothetical protein [Pseudoduganella sp. UC29_71]|uniref:hypothetical protein n=1 Tax=Pseudoduganella sp. UC29_71 TaxID=3350174 RepID=UPI00366AA3AD
MSKIAPHLLVLLNEIVEKHKLGLPLEAVLTGGQGLDEHERELLIDALVFEFTETGLHADDEPNERGREIETLIDLLGASRRP